MLTSPPLPEWEADKVCDYASRMSRSASVSEGPALQNFHNYTFSNLSYTYQKSIDLIYELDGVQVHVSRGDNNRSR